MMYIFESGAVVNSLPVLNASLVFSVVWQIAANSLLWKLLM
jgi:hypothetical protein